MMDNGWNNETDNAKVESKRLHQEGLGLLAPYILDPRNGYTSLMGMSYTHENSDLKGNKTRKTVALGKETYNPALKDK